MQLAFTTGDYFIVDKTEATPKKIKTPKEKLVSDKLKQKQKQQW